MLYIWLTHRLPLHSVHETRPWSDPGFNMHTAIQVELVSLAIAERFVAGREDILLHELRIAVARTFVTFRSWVQRSTISYLVVGVFQAKTRFLIGVLSFPH